MAVDEDVPTVDGEVPTLDGEVPTVDEDVPTLGGEVPTMDGVEGLGSTTASVTTTDFAIGPLVAATASL